MNLDLFWPYGGSKGPQNTTPGTYILHTSKRSSNELKKQISCESVETFFPIQVKKNPKISPSGGPYSKHF